MKCAIYIRTSTVEQNPENQLDACKKFAESRGYDIEGIYKEYISAYKQIERPKYEEIKGKAFRGEIQSVIVWALDRWVRNRDTLIEDINMLTQYNCKIHSVQEQYLEAVNIDGPLGKTIREFFIGLMGSLAEMESKRKSERIKIAYQNHKGKKWGRRNLPKRTVDEIINLSKTGLSIRQIANQVTYYDKNRNIKNISKSHVNNILKEYKEVSNNGG